MRSRCSVLLILVLCLSLAACTPATGPTPPPPTPMQHSQLISLAVVFGTGAFLREHPELGSLVWQIAHDATNATEGALDLTQLGPTLAAVIDRTSLNAERKMLLQMLVSVILVEVQAYVARAQLRPTQVQLLASDLFAAMERAALMRLGGVVPVAGG